MCITIGNGSVRFESVKTEPFKTFETWTELNHENVKLNNLKNQTVKTVVSVFNLGQNLKLKIFLKCENKAWKYKDCFQKKSLNRLNRGFYPLKPNGNRTKLFKKTWTSTE